MRASLSILFNKPMSQYQGIPSPGGYEVQTKDGKFYGFDFHESCGGIDPKNPHIITWCLKDEDIETFPEIVELRHKMTDITKITEFYLDMEGITENLNPDQYPMPVAILEFQLSFPILISDTYKNTKFVKINRHGTHNPQIGDFTFTKELLQTFQFS